ncbi:hypothetical protein QBC36DRAFT_141934 [Triangularia setosa]|uniref:Uncharacterized protein n=1 Tax=Triangularia setosa TaxID=2587417 RepID=A0AAN7A925_9PEZI|nr:hypothetical protein QBC36DRAFT_141934 [Podospora setosa]
MDQDQFGGRTDDDLFADDIEPVLYEDEAIATPPATTIQSDPAETAQAPAPKATPVLPVRKGLANSIHNRPNGSRASKNNCNHTYRPSAEATSASGRPYTSNTTAPPQSAQKGPAAKPQLQRTNNTTSIASDNPADSGDSAPSTRDEIGRAAMEKMKIINAQKMQRYQREKNDEEQHAIALAKSEENALRLKEEAALKRKEEERKKEQRKKEQRKQEQAARRKPAMGERNRYDADRVQNKGSKRMRPAPWDDGKVDLNQADTYTKAANGGVKGSTGSGLGASRYASQGQNNKEMALFEAVNRHRRSGNEQMSSPALAAPAIATTQKPKATDDFPALPSSGLAPTNTIASPTWVKPVGDWAEDVDF